MSQTTRQPRWMWEDLDNDGFYLDGPSWPGGFIDCCSDKGYPWHVGHEEGVAETLEQAKRDGLAAWQRQYDKTQDRIAQDKIRYGW